MEWLNEPASWQRNGDVLRVNVDPDTDFWRATGYGYVHDNGHVYGDRLPGDLDVSVRIRGAFASQYDQAGIMLRADEQTWLKTGLEFFEGRSRLSTVLTIGWSSWMVADLPPGTDEVTLRVSRRGDAVEVRYVAGDGAAELAALVFMPPDREVLAGIVCAAPAGTGFGVAFHDLRVVGREWAGQETADGVGWAGESAARDHGWVPEPAVGPGAGWASEAAGWEDERAGDRAAVWAGDDDQEAWDTDWARDTAGTEAGDTKERPAGKQAAGVPDGWDDELPADESLDWAKPQANEPAADWDRLSLSLSTTSWNAFAVARPEGEPGEPGREQPGEPAQEQPGKPTDDLTGRAGQDREVGTGERPEPPAGGRAERAETPAGPVKEAKSAGPAEEAKLAGPAEEAKSAGPAEAGKPGETARGKSGRGRKAKMPIPPALPSPADPADEWISLLTADSAEELSGPGPVEELSGPGPAGELSGPGPAEELSGLGPAGELSGPRADEPDPE